MQVPILPTHTSSKGGGLIRERQGGVKKTNNRNVYFNNSSTEAPRAFAIRSIVASVGFCLPDSIVLMYARSTPSSRHISPCDICFRALIFFMFAASFFADSDIIVILSIANVVS